jgi:hypothetical protein
LKKIVFLTQFSLWVVSKTATTTITIKTMDGMGIKRK